MHQLRVSALLAILLLSGCSTFERAWKEPAPIAAGKTFEGNWEGTWKSAKHHNASGRLRCLLTERSTKSFHAQFKADWLIFSSGYGTQFTAIRTGRTMEFSGQEDLGSLFGGLYTFKGNATPQRFTASYDSSYDRGTFEMRRVGGLPAGISQSGR